MVRNGKLLCPYEDHNAIHHDPRKASSMKCRKQQIADGLNERTETLLAKIKIKLIQEEMLKKGTPAPRSVFGRTKTPTSVQHTETALFKEEVSYATRMREIREAKAKRNRRAAIENNRKGIKFTSPALVQTEVTPPSLPEGYSASYGPKRKLSIFTGAPLKDIEFNGRVYELPLSGTRGSHLLSVRYRKGGKWSIQVSGGSLPLSALNLSDLEFYLWIQENLFERPASELR